MLTRHFLQQSAKQLGVEPKRISDAALARLATFGFPGNVRQLENICHWLTVMAPAQLIEPKDLPPEVVAGRRAEAAARRVRRSRAADAPRPPAPAEASPASPPCRCRRPPRRGTRGWESGPGSRGAGAAGQRPARRVGRADRRFESQADPHRAGQHARPPHRGRAEARHRPQHHHAQDPGAGAGVDGMPPAPREWAAARKPSPIPESDSQISTVTGAWSLGFFHLRGTRSMVQPLTSRLQRLAHQDVVDAQARGSSGSPASGSPTSCSSSRAARTGGSCRTGPAPAACGSGRAPRVVWWMVSRRPTGSNESRSSGAMLKSPSSTSRGCAGQLLAQVVAQAAQPAHLVGELLGARRLAVDEVAVDHAQLAGRRVERRGDHARMLVVEADDVLHDVAHGVRLRIATPL